MENKTLTEKQILRDLARIQLLDFDPSEEDSCGEEIMQKEHDSVQLQWKVPTRESRDLILAEEIIRFASVTDRPCTSNTHRIIIDPTPDSTSDTESFPCKRWQKEKRNNTTEHLKSEVADREIDRTATLTGATSRASPVATEAGISGSEPPLSASFRLSQPSASNLQDAHFPVGEAKVPIDPQPNTSSPQLPVKTLSAIPVTNRLLAAMAQNELQQSSSSDPVTLESTGSVEKKDNLLNNDGQLLGYFLEHLKTHQVSDSSLSRSPDAQGPATRMSPERSDELSHINQHILLTTQLEEMITKNMKVIVTSMLKHKLELQSLKKELNSKLELLQTEQDQTGAVKYKDYPQANQQEEYIGLNDEINTNQQEQIPAANVDVLDNNCNLPVAENPNENNFQNLDDNVEADHATNDDDADQSEFPEAVNLSGPEWSRPEKRRLGIVIRDISREMKTKELQKKKAKLLKKGRVIAQAIDNKIYDINKQITAVNKKALRHVALPLDRIQDYDWGRVASVLNAKRSPEECRTYWKCFLHPAINESEWNLDEVKEMEKIAQSHNFRNWKDIAQELKTGRSGYQCYMFYRKHMCPHSELRGTSDKK